MPTKTKAIPRNTDPIIVKPGSQDRIDVLKAQLFDLIRKIEYFQGLIKKTTELKDKLLTELFKLEMERNKKNPKWRSLYEQSKDRHLGEQEENSH